MFTPFQSFKHSVKFSSLHRSAYTSESAYQNASCCVS